MKPAEGVGPRRIPRPGRMAVVQTQVALVAILVVAQLWLVTLGLDEVLAGNGASVWLLALASTGLLALAVLVWRAGVR